MLWLQVSGSHLYWMIFLDYVLSVWVFFKSVVPSPLPPGVGTLKWPSGTPRLSLGLPSPFLLSPHVWIPVCPLPGICLSSPLSFPLPSPSCCLLPLPIWSWNTDRKTSACLARALCQKNGTGQIIKKKKSIKKECSLAKWGKQMFRGGFAVSGCQLKHLPYRIARCGHSSSCHRCGCFNIKYVNVYLFVSAQFSSPHHLCSPKSRVGKITDYLIARFIFTLFSEGFFLGGGGGPRKFYCIYLQFFLLKYRWIIMLYWLQVYITVIQLSIYLSIYIYNFSISFPL